MTGITTSTPAIPDSRVGNTDPGDFLTQPIDSVVVNLASYVYKSWETARLARREHEIQMLDDLRQRNGEYSPDKLSQIKAFGGSEVFMMLTSLKCRSAASWIRDVEFDDIDPPWDITPTPIPDISPDAKQQIVDAIYGEIQQMQAMGAPIDMESLVAMGHELVEAKQAEELEEATEKCELMKKKMKDQLAEGGWFEAFDQLIEDIVTFRTAIMKGPIVRKRPKLNWVQGIGGWSPDIQDELVVEFERVSPFDFYVAPNARHVDDSYVIERHRLFRTDLNALIGSPGYDDNAIRAVLDRYATSGLRNWLAGDQQRAEEEGRPSEWLDIDQPIEALEFTGSVPGKLLIQWGMDEDEIDDPTKEYNANVWVIGPYTIKAVLNYDPLGRKPYSVTSFEKIPGSIYGNSIPSLIKDIQQICNAAARSLVNNMGIASGPQVAINIDKLAPGCDTELRPWKKWLVTDDFGGPGGKPVEFYQPNPMVEQLLKVFEHFSKLADDYSGIPAYTYGDSFVGGAGRTASGLSMLLGAASKAIKQVISHIDTDIIEPVIERLYYHNMRYAEDDSIKGDVKVVARGAHALMIKEQLNVRRMEFLQVTANPVDSQIVGIQGRSALLREIAKGLDMPVDKVVPEQPQMMPQQPVNQMQGNVYTRDQQPPAELLPDGTPAGGEDVNQFQDRRQNAGHRG